MNFYLILLIVSDRTTVHVSVCACALAADKKQNTDRLGNVNNQVKAGGDKFDEFDWDISKVCVYKVQTSFMSLGRFHS